MGIDLASHAGTQRKVRLERTRPSEPRLNGYVIACSRSLVMMHCFDDFEPDGFTVSRLGDVRHVRSNEYERHWDRMLRGEKLLGALANPPRIDLRSMRLAIKSVAAKYGRMIIHCEDAVEAIEDFYIGEVVAVDEDAVRFWNFDALGRWDPEPSRIALDEITMIAFDCVYIRRFWKYLESPRPPRRRPSRGRPKT